MIRYLGKKTRKKQPKKFTSYDNAQENIFPFIFGQEPRLKVISWYHVEGRKTRA